ncbi:MAG TPA: polysaccharide biosynthesis/export family protein [Pyrinomonadaceae bacterium]|nr:polysaccharide biosynthesis/export family protein [Pyrinomonadaceae bacterium]
MRVRSLLLALALCAAAAPALAQDGAASVPQVSAPASAGAAMDVMGIKKYLLGPGDQLDLRVFNEPQFNGVLQVNDEGNVEVPFVDQPIPARCRTDREIKGDIVAALAKFLNKPQVSLRVTEMRSRPPAVVFGAVRSPSRVQMQRRARLLELLATSGGVTEAAGGDIQIFHTEPLMCPEPGDEDARPLASLVSDDPTQLPYEVYSITDLKLGKEEANPMIRPGDIVIVQEAKPVYLVGAVVSPQGLYIREGSLQLLQAIAMVGGLRKEAKASEVIIHRRKGRTGEVERVLVNFSDIRKQKAQDIALQPYDVIEVPDGSGGVKGKLNDYLKAIIGGSVMTLGQSIPTRVLY